MREKKRDVKSFSLQENYKMILLIIQITLLDIHEG